MNELNRKLAQHKIWLETAGKAGSQFNADELDMKKCSQEDFKYLTESFLADCDFSLMTLSGALLDHSELYSCKMIESTLDNVSFEKVDARFLDFRGALIKETTFHDADLDEIDFSGAVFENTTFAGANLWNCNFTDAILTNVDFNETAFYDVVLNCVKINNPQNLDRMVNVSIIITQEGKNKRISGESAIDWIKKHC